MISRELLAVSAVAYEEGEPSGLNRYIGAMVAALTARAPESRVYTACPILAARYAPSTRLSRPRMLARGSFIGRLLRMIWHQTTLPAILRRDGIRTFYSPVAEGMLHPNCAQVITIHDLLPLRFPAANPRLKHYFRFVLPRIMRASTAVVVDSEATKRDLNAFYGLGEVPVHVVYPAHDSGVFSPQTATPEAAESVRRTYQLGDYLLAVGETRPYKNLRRLMEAFARLRREDLQLVFVGKANKMDPDLVRFPRELGLEQRVRFLGYVPDRELAALYGGAVAFVFPSLYEGFGIPPLEAMACGCPVVCSRAASLPEVCGDAAEYVDPLEVDSIARGITRVVEHAPLRKSLQEKGWERVREFSYDKAAGEIVQILEQVAEARGSPGKRRRLRRESTRAVGGPSASSSG